jgi:hypothetical protein
LQVSTGEMLWIYKSTRRERKAVNFEAGYQQKM